MPIKKERTKLEVQAERAVVAAVRLPTSVYDPADPFGELRALVEQAGATVVGELTQNLPKPVSGTYMGEGKLQELRALCEVLDASTVIFDHDLSPRQISNIEEATGRKIVDRSELILDIFAGRATTAEAQLQVELAQLEYTYPRLRAMWDHLERIVGRGGIGGIGTRGPGEQQLEIDRRLVQNKVVDLRRRLTEIQTRKRREVQERKRDHFTVGVVGYTNAGKSTLFNTLTAGGAYSDNRLFATLITRTREWDLGGGLNAMLSDTVGFVRDLPHGLVASFKATLEEATHADLLLIVLDASDPAAELRYNAVQKTLDDLFAELKNQAHEKASGWREPPRVLLLNKIDKLASNAELLVWKQRHPDSIAISALPDPKSPAALSRGHDELVARIRRSVEGEVEEVRITLPLSDARAITYVENRAHVLERDYDAESVTLRARVGKRVLDALRASGSRFTLVGRDDPAPPPRAKRW